MITIGIDDTDIKDTRGTNAICRELVSRLGFNTKGTRIIRHQLLDDPRVPYTSKNGSASIYLKTPSKTDIPELVRESRRWLREWFIEGSDPGLCVTDAVPDDVMAFGQRCKRELIEQRETRELASRFGIHLEGLGGTEQGVIGALAAVGLVATGDDGRIVHLGGWPWPDDLKGTVDATVIFTSAAWTRSAWTRQARSFGRDRSTSRSGCGPTGERAASFCSSRRPPRVTALGGERFALPDGAVTVAACHAVIHGVSFFLRSLPVL